MRHQQQAAGRQVRRRGVDQPVEHEPAAAAGFGVARRAAPGEPLFLARQVRRVGDDHVEAATRDGVEQVAAQRLHPHPVEAGIEPGREHRAGREVDGGDGGAPASAAATASAPEPVQTSSTAPPCSEAGPELRRE